MDNLTNQLLCYGESLINNVCEAANWAVKGVLVLADTFLGPDFGF